MKTIDHLHMAGLLAREALDLALSEIEREVGNGFDQARITRLVQLAKQANAVLEMPAPKPSPRRCVNNGKIEKKKAPVLDRILAELKKGKPIKATDMGINPNSFRYSISRARRRYNRKIKATKAGYLLEE